jgi:tetratricopeptide (TPR) repeat protein
MPQAVTRSTGARCYGATGLLVAALLTACVGGPAPVSPEDIPDLEARVQREPGNGALLARYGEALFAAGRCDTAMAVSRRAAAARPDDAVPVLIIGQCQERANQHDDAIAGYQRYLAHHDAAPGAAAVRARELLARRDKATAVARQAIIQERQLAPQPGDPQTIAILPLEVVGDSAYQPLSRGLAQMLISDLSLIQTFRMVERLQIGALLDELALGQGGRVDPATAARVGRLVQAGRMVSGLAAVSEAGPVRLEATVVQATGEVATADAVTGQLRDLLRLEKDLVVSLAARLGYTLSEAERRLILENGTQNLQAFLAYSRGLLAEDVGDFSRAALYFSDAVQADPNFQAAKLQQQAAAAAPAVQQAQGQVAVVVSQTGQQQQQTAAAPIGGALDSGMRDMAGTMSERSSGQTDRAVDSNTSAPSPVTRTEGTRETVTGTVNVRFQLP